MPTLKPPQPRNTYSPRVSVLSPTGEEPAQQQFKEDCDINTIMQRFQKSGAIDHVSNHQPQYGFATPSDYHTSMNIIAIADSMFNDLPSGIRNRFSNNPEEFLEFVQNPDNADEAKKLGIALSQEAAQAASELPGEAKTGEEIASPGQDVPASVEATTNPNE